MEANIVSRAGRPTLLYAHHFRWSSLTFRGFYPRERFHLFPLMLQKTEIIFIPPFPILKDTLSGDTFVHEPKALV